MNDRRQSRNCCVMRWRFVIAVLVPIVLVPVLFINNSPEKKLEWLYVVSIMIVFWITEAIPHAVTSLIPIGLFPLLGVMNTTDTCKLYVHETVFTLLGSLIIASSVESSNLHKRIALKVLCHVKCYHRRLHFVMMVTTMFISMWIQNFIVVVMMSSVCLSILEQLEVQGSTVLVKPQDIEDKLSLPTRLTMGYMFGISYAATLGGCGSLLGTPANLSFVGILETYLEIKIDFIRFFHYCAPIMLLNTILTWIWLQLLFMGLLRRKSDDAVALMVTEDDAKEMKKFILHDYKTLGKLTAAEIQVAVTIILFHLVLTFRTHHFVQNWERVAKLHIGDASLTIIFVLLLFIIPSDWNCCRKSADDNPQNEEQSLLTWTLVRRRVPWGLMFVLGAGIALAESGKQLEMHGIFVESVNKVAGFSLLLSFLVCLGCQIFTEFSSNATAANIVLPFFAAFCLELERESGIKSINLMFPAALCLSMAFHTPIGTPGNAYVAGLINIPTKDMLYCGIGPSIITLLTYWSTFPTYGTYIFHNNTAAT